MEIAKFIFACVSIALTIFGVIAGLWKGYNKKVVARITGVEKDSQEKIEKVKEECGKRIESLEYDVHDLRKVVSEGFQQRLSNIEGEMKGMSNILKQIQGWFIDNTPKG